MQKHVSEEQLIGIILHTLTQAERECIETELEGCAECRSRLHILLSEYHSIEQGLATNLGALRPSARANFATLSSQLSQSRRFGNWSQARLAFSGAMALAMIVLVVFLFVRNQRAIRQIWITANGLPAPSAGDVIQVGPRRPSPYLVKNGDFEEELTFRATGGNWFRAGSRPQDYDIKRDTSQFASGTASAYLGSRSEDASGFGTLMQTFSADDHLEQRIRLTAQIKSQNVQGWAGLWLRVDGPNNEPVQFDNMQNRPVQGSTDWTTYEIVLNVPPEATSLNLGILLSGTGQVWIDDVQLKEVDTSIAVTQLGLAGLLDDFDNPDFEGPFITQSTWNGWFLAGTKPDDYDLAQDTSRYISGAASALLASKSETIAGFGTLMQSFKPDNYNGQRIRLTAQIKTEDVRDWAGLWLRVDGPNNEMLQFDNMENRPIRGTTDWTGYEIVVDVPEEATSINLGVLLEGTGRVWIDDVQLESVGNDVPSTNLNAYNK